MTANGDFAKRKSVEVEFRDIKLVSDDDFLRWRAGGCHILKVNDIGERQVAVQIARRAETRRTDFIVWINGADYSAVFLPAAAWRIAVRYPQGNINSDLDSGNDRAQRTCAKDTANRSGIRSRNRAGGSPGPVAPRSNV